MVKTFSDRLKYARRLRRYTQQELARISGLSQSAIASYESGSRHSSRSLRALTSALKVSFHWLDTGKGEIETSDAAALPASSLREPGQTANYSQGALWPFEAFTREQYLSLSAQQKKLAEELILTFIRSSAATYRADSKDSTS
jgi:HTH-type transcriptional regulator, competence development regulator